MSIDFTSLEPRPGEALVTRVLVPRPKWLQIGYFVAVLAGVGFGLVWIPAGLLALLGIRLPHDEPAGLLLIALGMLAVAGAIAMGLVQRRWTLAHRRAGVAAMRRLPEFAADNGFEYVERTTEIPFPHLFFATELLDPRLERVLRSRGGRGIVVGDFVVDIPQRGGRRFPVTTGFVAIRLDRPLPHILLVPRSDFLPGFREARRRLRLEGDFDRYFTLYCPPGAEIDALAVITPDVMAAMVDDAAVWQAEIVDDWLVLGFPLGFAGFGVDEYRRLFELVDTVGREYVQQTDRPWAPPSSAAGLDAAPPADRLRRGPSRSGRVVLAGLAVWAAAIFAVPALVIWAV